MTPQLPLSICLLAVSLCLLSIPTAMWRTSTLGAAILLQCHLGYPYPLTCSSISALTLLANTLLTSTVFSLLDSVPSPQRISKPENITTNTYLQILISLLLLTSDLLCRFKQWRHLASWRSPYKPFFTIHPYYPSVNLLFIKTLYYWATVAQCVLGST